MSIHFRTLELKDQARLVELLAAMDYPEVGHLVEQNIAVQISHPDALTLVAEINQKVVGFISVHFMTQLALNGEVCFINFFSIDPLFRSQGVGAMLLKEAEHYAQARACYSMELSSNLRRAKAHAFYLKQGYIETSRYFVKEF